MRKMTPQQLKNSILQMAMQGKLVEQRPEEGTGEALYQEIQAEKKKLIQAGKIKKSKKLPDITEEEIPFEIPESWKWVRLGEISSVITKGTTPRGGKISYTDSGIGFLRAENIGGFDKIDKTNLRYVDEKTHLNFLKRSIIRENDILITIAGTLGRTGLVRNKDLPLNANQAVSIVRLVDINNIDLLYIIYILNSPLIQKNMTAQRKTTAIPNLTLEIISKCIIALPPLSEQKRIVAKIEEIQPLLDRYEKAYNRLEAYNQKFPENLKKSILQHAVEGKLVEQRPEEGTGEALYQEIQAEKKKLIQEGKIKKSKKLPEITEEEIPFEIPENWKWVRLDDLGDYRKGPFGSSLTKSMFVPKSENSIKVYEQKNAIKKNWHLGDYYITKDYYNEKMKNFTVSPGDIIVSCAGTIGETYVMPEDIELGIINQALMRMKIFKPINVDFFLIYFEYILKRQARKNSKGSAIKNIPPFSIFKKLLFPLPPLKEQDRIVSKIEELMPLVEKCGEDRKN